MGVFQYFNDNLEEEYQRLWNELHIVILKYPDLKEIIKKQMNKKNTIAVISYLRVLKKYLEMIPEWGTCKPWKPKEFPLLDFGNVDMTNEPRILSLSDKKRKIRMKVY